ncbi:MAG: TolC family protein [Halanaerobium sp.]
MKKSYLYIFLLLMLLLFSITAAAAEEINLKKAAEIMIEDNRELQNSRKDLENAESDIDLAVRSFFPSLTLDNTYTKLDEGRSELVEDPSAPLDFSFTEGSDTTYSNSLRLTQPIWYGNEVLLNKDIAELNIETEKANYESLLEDKLFSLIQAYYGVLQTKGVVKIREEAQKTAAEHLRVVENNLEAGIAIKQDFLQSKIEQRRAEEELQAAENDLKIRKRRFKQLITADKDYSLEKPELNFEVELDRDKLYNTAVENNSQLLALEINKKIVEINKRIKDIPQRPKINANASYNWEGDKFFDEESWSVSITGSIPIYDGGKSKIEAGKQQKEKEKINNSIKDLLENIDIEIEDTLLSLEELKNKIELEQLSLENAEENLELANKSYQAGVAKNIDVINAQSTYRQAKTSLLQAEYNYEIEKFRVLYESGRLSEYFKEVINNEK